MKLKLLSLIFLLVSVVCFAQKTILPKNLKQAIVYLNKDCSDSIKAIIIKTPDSHLKELSYPWGGKYKTIYNWTSNENSDSKIVRYLNDKGVEQHKEVVILTTFKRFLEGKPYNEKQILKPYQDLEIKWASEDKVRFTTDSLRGIYIPKDINDSFIQINSFWSDSTKTMIKEWSEDTFIGNVHLGFGMWMRNNWQLWSGSRLSKYFNDMGINHPDDMSGIILRSYHRNLQNSDIKLEEQIQFYKDYWADSKNKKTQQTEEEFSKYKVGDTVTFTYPNGYSSKQQENSYDVDTCIAEGVITALNSKKHFIKVKLNKSCDKKGIISYDNEGYVIYNQKTGKTETPKRKIEYLKQGKETWFPYSEWETID